MPVSIYTDKGVVFKVTAHNEENEFITQYERILDELSVELIHAHSPQAKGRIERSFGTDQDRLVKELKLAGISTMEEANTFIKEYYIPKMNKMFTRPAAQEGNLHRPIGTLNLENIFCIKATRIVQNDWTIQYNNRFFQIDDHRRISIRPKDVITVHEKLCGSLFLSIRGSSVAFREIKEKKIFAFALTGNKAHKPSPDHPWKQYPARL